MSGWYWRLLDDGARHIGHVNGTGAALRPSDRDAVVDAVFDALVEWLNRQEDQYHGLANGIGLALREITEKTELPRYWGEDNDE